MGQWHVPAIRARFSLPSSMPSKPDRTRPGPRTTSNSASQPGGQRGKQPATPFLTRPASALHPCNRHQGRYDFPLLLQHDPGLRPFVLTTPAGEPSIDFTDAQAVKALNRALLLAHYGIRDWDLPPNNLCPPVPGRVDMLHYLADLLGSSNHGKLPGSADCPVSVLDIGTGASCIYPLLGASEYGWQFVASDINPASLAHAQTILGANPQLATHIRLRHQPDASAIFKGIIQSDDWFDLTLCNPPFHASLAQAQDGTQRKWRNLGKAPNQHQSKKPDKASSTASPLNFGGQDAELWCEGGERAFILQMIKESSHFANHCFWFSSLVSKADNLPAITAAIRQAGVTATQTIAMSQGQKQSRVVAWTFLNPAQQTAWRARQRG